MSATAPTLPVSPKVRAANRVIAKVAPPKPDCFESDVQWHSYLRFAQQAPQPRPFIGGVWQDFNYCQDCTMAFSHQMSAERRCNPSQLRTKVKKS